MSCPLIPFNSIICIKSKIIMTNFNNVYLESTSLNRFNKLHSCCPHYQQITKSSIILTDMSFDSGRRMCCQSSLCDISCSILQKWKLNTGCVYECMAYGKTVLEHARVVMLWVQTEFYMSVCVGPMVVTKSCRGEGYVSFLPPVYL